MLSDDIAVKLLNVVLFREGKVDYMTARRPFSALSFRLTSAARFHVDGQVIEAGPGSVCFVPEDVDYRRESAGEELLVFHFSLYNCVDKRIQVFTPADPEKYRAKFEEARAIWEARGAGYRYHATVVFYEILCELERDGAVGQMPRARFLTDAEQYMNEHYMDADLSIADVARSCGVSDAYFRRAFHMHFGVSPKQYLHTLRMQRAMSLLLTNVHTQSEIARMTGFRDVKYFRVAFKAYTGRSIRAYLANPDYMAAMHPPV